MKNENEEENNQQLLDKVFNVSDSQKDREDLDTTREFNIIRLLNEQIDKLQTKNLLKEETINKIKTRLNSGDNEISTNALIRLLEILDKGDTDLMISIVNASKDAAFLNAIKQDRKDSEGLNLTKNDVELVKKLIKSISFLETLNKTEENK